MKPRKFTRAEKKENREKNLKASMAGSGLFVYENNTDGDLKLPKKTASGQLSVGPRKRFQGDSYYMAWVKPPLRLLRFIETIIEQDGQPAHKTEEPMADKKLILDQPDTITPKGKVEHVVASEPQQQLNDNANPAPPQDTLLTEYPLDGVEIILS